MDRPSNKPEEDQLTSRELEILTLIANGLTNQQIADRTFVAFETVKWYLKQIYGKLQASNRAQAVFAARALGLIDALAPPQEQQETPHNLPSQLAAFVGRENELAQLDRLLNTPECRLLTVAGLGGMGKTRLALEAANAQLPRYHDGVYFVALAPLTESSQMPATIAEAARLSIAPGQPLISQLLSYLRDKQMLLILDNFEHLLAGADLLRDVLQATSSVKMIVTSRERLRLQDEVVFRLGGLTYADLMAPETAARSSAVELFLLSARRVNPSFELTSDTLGALHSISQALDGMPLGILLAASWIEVLSPVEIAQEIERSFEFLEGQWRDLPERQRSLVAVFESSWNLLSEVERSAMRCFSIFRGGFSRVAAEEVAGASLATLTALVNKSFLARDSNGRFEMHELLRQYATRKLDSYPEEREQFRKRHAAYYAAMMDQSWTPIRTAELKSVVDGIEVEIDNIRSAWTTMLDQALLPHLTMTARVLWYFLMVQARYDEAIELFGRGVDKLQRLPPSEARDIALAEMLHSQGFFFTAIGQPDNGKALSEASLARLQGLHADEIRARAYITLSRSEHYLGRPTGIKSLAQQGLAVARSFRDPWHIGIFLFLIGFAEVQSDNFEEGRRTGEEALSYLVKAGDVYYEGLCSSLVLAHAALGTGRYADAERFYLAGLTYFESIDDQFEIAQTRRDLSELYALMADYGAALQTCRESMRHYTRMGQTGHVLSNIRFIARVNELQSNWIQAVELLAFIVDHPDTLPVDKLQARSALDRLGTLLPYPEFSSACERGQVLTLEAVTAKLLRDT